MLTVETRPDVAITWAYWNECQGVLVASTPQERKRFERWEQCGRDYQGQWWKKEKQA